jgi:hypothetical protein
LRIFKRGALCLDILNLHYAVVIMEVLSESTEGYGRGGKLELYRGIETLKEYVFDEFAKAGSSGFFQE